MRANRPSSGLSTLRRAKAEVATVVHQGIEKLLPDGLEQLGLEEATQTKQHFEWQHVIWRALYGYLYWSVIIVGHPF
jgi:hypothetical protein